MRVQGSGFRVWGVGVELKVEVFAVLKLRPSGLESFQSVGMGIIECRGL